MRLTQVQASMVATALYEGFVYPKRSLCCGTDAKEACAVIVGRRKAAKFREWCYEELGCAGDEDIQQHYLNKIAAAVE